MTAPTVVASFAKNSREMLRVALDNYRGHDLVDVRVCVPLADHADVLTPTKSGVSLNVALLPDLIEALQLAATKAKQLGLIEVAR